MPTSRDPGAADVVRRGARGTKGLGDEQLAAVHEGVDPVAHGLTRRCPTAVPRSCWPAPWPRSPSWPSACPPPSPPPAADLPPRRDSSGRQRTPRPRPRSRYTTPTPASPPVISSGGSPTTTTAGTPPTGGPWPGHRHGRKGHGQPHQDAELLHHDHHDHGEDDGRPTPARCWRRRGPIRPPRPTSRSPHDRHGARPGPDVTRSRSRGPGDAPPLGPPGHRGRTPFVGSALVTWKPPAGSPATGYDVYGGCPRARSSRSRSTGPTRWSGPPTW